MAIVVHSHGKFFTTLPVYVLGTPRAIIVINMLRNVTRWCWMSLVMVTNSRVFFSKYC